MMCIMTEVEKKEALAYSSKTLEIEGLHQNTELIQYTLQYLDGKISSEEAIKNISKRFLKKS